MRVTTNRRPTFDVPRSARLTRALSVRLTDEAGRVLDAAAESAGVSVGDVVRRALQYWLDNAPDAPRAADKEGNK